MNNSLLLGDILVNKINNEDVYTLTKYNFTTTNQSIIIKYNELNMLIPNIILTLLNNEQFYPDVEYFDSELKLNLRFYTKRI